MRQVPGSLVAAAAFAMVAAGCATNPTEQVANQIRAARSPIVREVIFRPESFIDPAEVIVYLRPGATKDAAARLWCEVVVPAGGTEFEDHNPVGVWDDQGWTPMAEGITCPLASPVATGG